MKKNLLFIAAAAMIFAACSDSELRNELQNEQAEIGFSTFTGKLTRAENSSATDENALDAYNTTFKVWGSKYVVRNNASTEERVFGINDAGEVVSYVAASTSWTYSPARFWDKSATSYSFYAAAPSGKSWVWNNGTKKLSLADFVISGYNSVTGTPAITVDAAKGLTAALDTEDLMISTDVTDYTNYTSAAVNLHFNHILSRLNIGVRKAAILDNFDVKLNAIKVYNMVNKGSFNENTVLTPDDATDDEAALLAAGTIKRWTLSSVATDKFTTPMSYEPNEPLEITSTVSTAASNYQYVYEGLVIPQAVAYNPTVEVNNYTANQNPAQFKLDGSNADATSAPYIFIDYEIWTKDVKYTAEEAAEYNTANSLNEGDEGYVTTSTVKTPAAKMDGYQYYYNLADVFNGPDNGPTATDAINFCEGWQNTLMITLSPAAIVFDANVYEWAIDKNVEVNITE